MLSQRLCLGSFSQPPRGGVDGKENEMKFSLSKINNESVETENSQLLKKPYHNSFPLCQGRKN